MSEQNTTSNDTYESLLAQAQNDIRKSERDVLKAKLKDIAKKINDGERTIRLLKLEGQKLVEDFNAGIN